MVKPILDTETGTCFLCRRRTDTALHHIYFGAKRKMSDQNGFTVFLCPDCHQYAPHAVHRCRDTDLYIKKLCQAEYEKTHSRADFMRLVGRNYL